MEKLNLPCNIQKAVDDFVANLKNIYSDQLVAIVLYGSAASGEYAGRHSNVNLAVILKDTAIQSLKKASRFINKNRFSIINPIFFTEEYIKKSTDVFPVEFLDIKENHIILYGKDVFGDLQIDIKNLRFQCEQELKSKILNIKKLYLRMRDRAILKDLLFKSFTSSLHILRNLVRLKGKMPSYKKKDVLDEVARELTVDASVLRKILDAKNKNIRLNNKDIDELFTILVETLEDIAGKVDLL
jgi:predicted nucleotidyltransferase